MDSKSKRILFACLTRLPLAILILLILINFYLGINKAVTGNPIPKLFGFSPLIILSGSMEPAIYPGDVVVICGQAAEKYEIGDIATYLEGQTAYTHRIVREENGLFVMKGDNNNTEDAPIPPDRFEGKVLFTIPKVGLAILFFKKPYGIIVLTLLFLCVYSEGIIRKIIEKCKK